MIKYSEDMNELGKYLKEVDRYKNYKNAIQFSLAYNHKKNEGVLTLGFIKIIKGRDNIDFVDYKISKGDLLNGD